MNEELLEAAMRALHGAFTREHDPRRREHRFNNLPQASRDQLQREALAVLDVAELYRSQAV